MIERHAFPLVLLGIVAVALCGPLWDVHWFHSHEGQAYLMRTLEFASGLARGEVYPRWCPDFYGGYGSPFFVFYAPLVYAVSAFGMSLGLSVVAALKVTATLGSIAAGAGAYWLGYGETRRVDVGLVVALIYLSAPYRVCDLMVRGDVAEFMAYGFLPGALALYRALASSANPLQIPLLGTAAAAMHAGMILSHTLVGLWGTGLVVLVAAVQIWQLRRRRAAARIAATCVVLVGALALASAYTLPALFEQSSVRIDRMIASGYDVSNHWLVPRVTFESGMFDVRSTLAPALVLCLLILRRRGALLCWCLLVLAVLFFAASHPRATVVWQSGAIPFAAMIQFPWRLFGFGALTAAVATGIAWSLRVPKRAGYRVALAVLGGAVLLHHTWPNTALLSMPASMTTPTTRAIREGIESATGVDEYLPRDAKVPTRPREKLVAEARAVSVLAESSEGNEHDIVVEAGPGGSAVLALHHYPGWSVHTREGPGLARLSSSSHGLVRLKFPEAGRYRARVYFSTTPLRALASAVSLLTAVALYPLLHFGMLAVLRRRASPTS